jgi:hypothetical protein
MFYLWMVIVFLYLTWLALQMCVNLHQPVGLALAAFALAAALFMLTKCLRANN